MDFFYVSLLISLLAVFFAFLFYMYKPGSSSGRLPPGKTGFPLIGESYEFLSTGWKGHPETFIFDRIAKYSSQVFKTNIFGDNVAFLCGAPGNKFLYANENKHVQLWWHKSVEKFFPNSVVKSCTKVEGLKLKNMLPNFLKGEAIPRYVGIMDEIAIKHFASGWENHDEVKVFPLTKNYAFTIAAKVFLSLEDPVEVAKLLEHFHVLACGFLTLPIDFPGTPFSKALKVSRVIRKQILGLIKQRKIDLAEGKASPSQDIMSYMLALSNEDGSFMNDANVADKLMGFLISGHETAASACAFVVKYLAELPEIYEGVYKEQMEIAKSKAPGELLNMEDIKNMKYSWNVVCEVLRFAPPFPGIFREVIEDFMFNGFKIPKGWKIFWSAHSTHRNPEYFPEPLKFDPSRFEGSGPAPYTFVPFGGGPRMCPGREYARLEILIFMHHLVKKFKWEKIIADEKIIVAPLPFPAKGLPVRLYAHN